MTTLPWAPLVTLERNRLPEVTLHGILHIVDGHQKALLSIGDTDSLLWSRSLTKPFQLLASMPLLKKAYPRLSTKHYAMMLASHSGELLHVNTLKEILFIGDLNESMLRCPKSYPMSDDRTHQMKTLHERPKAFFHPCSGKHLSALLVMRAIQEPTSKYLIDTARPYQNLRNLLAFMLKMDRDALQTTLDSCGMPNFGLTAESLAWLYCLLAQDVAPFRKDDIPDNLISVMSYLDEIKNTMQRRPTIVGGVERLDSLLLEGKLTDASYGDIVAKEGAEGLLAVGIAPCRLYPKGLGIFLKLASGHQKNYLQLIIQEVLIQLQLKSRPRSKEDNDGNLYTSFHFNIKR